MKYCRFQQNSQAHYGLVESVAGREAIVRILLTSPEEAGGDMESLRTMMKMKVNYLFFKPIDLSELRSTLACMITRRNSTLAAIG